MSSGPTPASASALCMVAMIGLPSGLARVLETFEHQGGGAFREHEAVAVLGKRLGGALRRIVLGGKRREERETHQRFRCQRRVGANRQRRFAVAAPDRLHAKLDGAGARCAGGVERDRRSLGAEMLGEVLA